MPRRAGSLLLTLLAGTAGAGCSDDQSMPVRSAGAAERPRRATPPTDVTLPGIAAVPGGYAVRPAADAGSVVGTVSMLGAAPADTTVRPDPALFRPCGPALVDRAVVHRGALVSGAVVWLSDVRAGKAMPTARRYELELQRCQLSPRALPVTAGGTLNVHTRDPLSLQLRAVHWPTGETRASWRLSDAGQVVPDDRVLADAGTLEVRGESLPWMRAWVLAFDHPYFASTSDTGAFALDGVPPGSYTLVAWHPRLGRSEQAVTVAAGQPATVAVSLGR